MQHKFPFLCGLIVSVTLILNAVLHAETMAERMVSEIRKWEVNEADFSPLSSVGNCRGPYLIALVCSTDSSFIEIRIMKDNAIIYSWKGHRFSTFSIRDDRLIYADFGIGADGGDIVSVDLKTGKQLWRSPLVAYDGKRISHSASQNNILVEPGNKSGVRVWGREFSGRYVEVKDWETGKTLAHRLFDEGCPEPRVIEATQPATTRPTNYRDRQPTDRQR